MILASAWEHNDILWSEDNQLNRFAASQGEYQRSVGGTLKIRFPQAPRGQRGSNSESKGYINKGSQPVFDMSFDPLIVNGPTDWP